MILEPEPVKPNAFPFARNITVKWTKPNLFGELKNYEVNYYFNSCKTTYLNSDSFPRVLINLLSG